MPAGEAIAERLRQLLPSLPAAERRVARVLLADYPVAGLETIARLAARAGASGPTVLRLTARLGFAGYPELQRGLRQEIASREHSPLAGYAALAGQQADPEADVAAGAGRLLSAAVQASLDSVDRADFARTAGLLCDTRIRILASGGRYSGLLAEYLAAHLQQLRPQVSAVRDSDRAAASLDLGRRDCAVLFDFRRYQPDVLAFGQAAAAGGARVVLITDPWLSPLAAVASAVLTAQVTAPSPFDSLVPALAVVEALIAAVVRELGDAPRDRIAAYDAYWSRRQGIGAVPAPRGAPDPAPRLGTANRLGRGHERR
ncbi:MAG TPA: MurR/RpiR family transcriptional regulator [Streptosporangiaceae bacterium]|nr:MurR/RpiR family transcriptional regulator [Streptosporangiaceae bacterium]